MLSLSAAHARVQSARRHAEEDLLFTVAAQAASAQSGSLGYSFENIVGVGSGERHVRGRPTGEPAITVYVVVKAHPELLEPGALVPVEYEGVPTDVVESGEFAASGERGRFRPSPGGVSVAHFQAGAGTLGFIARRGGSLCIVSNNHVLARENDAARGSAILQPGPADGGKPDADRIAELAEWLPLNFDGDPTPVDAAVAETDAESVDLQNVSGLGPLVLEPLEVADGLLVRKCGRSSGVTRGRVVDAEATVRTRYGSKYVFLTDQFLVTGLAGELFSERGDSGSLVVEEQTRRPVGLLCGGSPRYSIVTPIARVLDGLGLSFVI